MPEELVKKFMTIGLSEQKAKETIKNDSLSKTLNNAIEEARKYYDGEEFNKSVGKLLYQSASTIKNQIKCHLPLLIEYIVKEKIDSEIKLNAAIEYLLANVSNQIDIKKFEANSGVGIIITPEQIEKAVEDVIAKYKDEIIEKRYRFNTGLLMNEAKKSLKFAEGKLVKNEVDVQILHLLGSKTEQDLAKPVKEIKKVPKKEEAKNDVDTGHQFELEEITKNFLEFMKSKSHFHKPGENYVTDGYVVTPNTKELLKKHLEITGGKVRTRFPPEPNGILHIGHAKAVNVNFGYAKACGGVCFLRFDDTNPEKEEEKFVIGIIEIIEWLGYKPYKVTYTSSYFNELYNFACELIKRGHAYVCHQKQEEIKGFNPPPSPWRNRSVEENMRLFQDMKNGKIGEGEATLRMKTTLEEGKQDPVAYRIKFLPHHRTGNQWCIYPTYDFSHCLCDSLENITHSLCTKEFQSRRSAYYWVCNVLDIYCPVQWEYSRCNVNNTVVSKRKIAKIIDEKIVNDWDDPRLYTLLGLRRRGYPAEAIKLFTTKLGLTGAETVIDVSVLESCVRDVLNVTAPRAMAVLNPLKVRIINFPDDKKVPIYVDVPDFPSNPNKKSTHSIPFETIIFIEKDDFKEQTDDKNYKRLTLNQKVGLRHAGYVISVEKVIKDGKGKVIELFVSCENVKDMQEKPKSFIHWVSTPFECEIRLYEPLFFHKNPEDPNEVPGGFLSDCNRNALTVIKHGLVDISVKHAKVYDKFQFERVGYFSVDPDSKPGHFVFNRTISLKEGTNKN